MKKLLFFICLIFISLSSINGQSPDLDSLGQGKTLRVTLAMGGGVSLGSFSGASLTESLKVLLLYGRDDCGNLYKDIELDGMSGSSAGAMSLAIMLRALIDYESILDTLGKTEIDMIQKIDRLYGKDTYFSNPAKQKQLIALQTAQDLQEKIWVDELSIEKLFGDKSKAGFEGELDNTFSLLSREFLKELINKYVILDGQNMAFDNKQILSKERFIMANSLSNLTPIKPPFVLDKYNKLIKGSKQNPEDFKLVENLLQSTSSYNHKEVRVMDFVFKENPKAPTDSRWMKFLAKSTNTISFEKSFKAPMDFQMSITPHLSKQPIEQSLQDEAWKTLSATVMACGAFPLAFEPVFLKRYKEEFPDNGWPEKFSVVANSLKSLDSLQKNSYIDGEYRSVLNYDNFNFPYVDGGTFNNEPIKEAFKIANFIDYNKHSSSNDYDRLILFVDPIVRKQDPTFQMSAYSTIDFVDTDTSKVTYNKKKHINKSFGLGSQIVTMLKNQGAIKDEHIINDFEQNIQLKKQLTKYLLTSKVRFGEEGDLLVKSAINKIKSHLTNTQIPYGTRSFSQYLIHRRDELIAKYPRDSIFMSLRLLKPASLEKILITLGNNLQNNTTLVLKTEVRKVCTANDCFQVKNTEKLHRDLVDEVLQLLLVGLTDVTLNNGEKDENAVLVSISPFNIVNKSIAQLPGAELEAFAGFASYPARKYAFEYGRLCAIGTLGRTDFRAYTKLSNNEETSCKNPFISNEISKSLINSLKTEIIDQEFYLNLDSYASNVSSKIADQSVDRAYNMFYIHQLKRLFIGVGGGTGINFYDNVLVKKVLKKNLRKGLANSILYEKLIPITVKVKSKKKHVRIIAEHDQDYTTTITPYKDDGFTYFNLYLYKTNGEFNFYAKPKIAVDNCDPNLGTECNTSTRYKINSLNFKYGYMGKQIAIPLDECKNPKNSIFHSLKILEFHIAPTLEIDMSSANPHFIFVENTKPLSLEF